MTNSIKIVDKNRNGAIIFSSYIRERLMESVAYNKKILSAGKLLFVSCFLAYSTAYLCRINYTAALTAIVADGVFSKSHAGLIGTVYFFCYGAGQVFSGILGDRVSPYKMIGTGLLGTILANIAMPLCSSSYVVMSVIWGINGIVQSMLWTPILYIMSNVLPDTQRDKACLYMAASYPLGSLLSYILSAATIRFASWHFAFYAPAAIASLVLVLWCVSSAKTSRVLGRGERVNRKSNGQPQKTMPLAKLFAVSGAAIICIGILIQGMLKDGVTSWVPTLITEKYSVSASFSVLLSAVLPIINLSGAWFATKLFEGGFRRNEAAAAAFCFALTLIPLVGLIFVGKYHIALCVLFFATFTTLIVAINHLFITLIPVRFAKYGRASTVGGIFNSCTYIGSAVSTYCFGAVSERLGWTATVLFWLILGAAGAAVCLACVRKYGKFANAES